MSYNFAKEQRGSFSFSYANNLGSRNSQLLYKVRDHRLYQLDLKRPMSPIRSLSDHEHDDTQTIKDHIAKFDSSTVEPQIAPNAEPIHELHTASKIISQQPISIPAPAQATNEEQPKDLMFTWYFLLYSLLLFIFIHIIPLLEAFPVLLKARMGSIIASAVVGGLCLFAGYNLALSRPLYYQLYNNIRQHKSFNSVRSLCTLLMLIYLTSYPVVWMFNSLFKICSQSPVVGSIIVLLLLSWGSILVCVITLFSLGKLTWSLSSTIYSALFRQKVKYSDRRKIKNGKLRKSKSKKVNLVRRGNPVVN